MISFIKKRFILIIFFSIYIIFTIPSCSNSREKKLTLRPDQISYLEDLEKQEFILIEAQLNKTYIIPSLWNGMDAKLKENFSATLAIYCGNRKGTELYWVEIYDKQSGKKLAKYSHSWGFDVY